MLYITQLNGFVIQCKKPKSKNILIKTNQSNRRKQKKKRERIRSLLCSFEMFRVLPFRQNCLLVYFNEFCYSLLG